MSIVVCPYSLSPNLQTVTLQFIKAGINIWRQMSHIEVPTRNLQLLIWIYFVCIKGQYLHSALRGGNSWYHMTESITLIYEQYDCHGGWGNILVAFTTRNMYCWHRLFHTSPVHNYAFCWLLKAEKIFIASLENILWRVLSYRSRMPVEKQPAGRALRAKA